MVLISGVTKCLHLIYDIAWSPDDSRVASAHYDGKVRIWRDGRLLHEITADSKASAYDVDWSPDSQFLVSASYREGVRLWDLSSAEPRLLSTLNDAPAVAAGWHRNGETIATQLHEGARVEIYQSVSGDWQLTNQSTAGGSYHALSWSPDGTEFVVGCGNGELRCISSNGVIYQTIRAHLCRATDVEWMLDGKELISCSEDGTVRTWNATTGEPLRVLIPMIDGSSTVLSGGGKPIFNHANGFNHLRYVIEQPDGRLAIMTASEFAQQVEAAVSAAN